MRLLVVDKSKKAEILLEKHCEFPSLKVLVLMEPVDESLKKKAADLGVDVIQFEELILFGGTSVNRAPPIVIYS